MSKSCLNQPLNLALMRLVYPVDIAFTMWITCADTLQSAKRAFARLEGHNDPKRLQPTSQFLSGGFGGMVAQYAVIQVLTKK